MIGTTAATSISCDSFQSSGFPLGGLFEAGGVSFPIAAVRSSVVNVESLHTSSAMIAPANTVAALKRPACSELYASDRSMAKSARSEASSMNRSSSAASRGLARRFFADVQARDRRLRPADPVHPHLSRVAATVFRLGQDDCDDNRCIAERSFDPVDPGPVHH